MSKSKKIIIFAAIVIFAAAAIVCAEQLWGGSDKPSHATGEVSVLRSDFIPSNDIIDTYVLYPERFTEKIARSFQMDAAATDSFFDEPENWLAYELVLHFRNVSDSPLTFYGLRVTDNGKNGVYVCTELEDGVGVAAGSTADVSVAVLCSNGELSDEQVSQLVGNMSISALYGLTSQEADAADETSAVELS